MKIREQGNKPPIPARSSSRVEVENDASLAIIAETEVEAASYLRESIGNVAKPIAQHRTVNDFDYALGEAARTLRNEVEAIARLAGRDEAASRALEGDQPVLPSRDIAGQVRSKVGRKRSKAGRMQASTFRRRANG
jgi:hypothetical protein